MRATSRNVVFARNVRATSEFESGCSSSSPIASSSPSSRASSSSSPIAYAYTSPSRSASFTTPGASPTRDFVSTAPFPPPIPRRRRGVSRRTRRARRDASSPPPSPRTGTRRDPPSATIRPLPPRSTPRTARVTARTNPPSPRDDTRAPPRRRRHRDDATRFRRLRARRLAPPGRPGRPRGESRRFGARRHRAEVAEEE